MAGAYGVTVDKERRAESHLRSFEEMLAGIFELDDAPLAVPRPAERRLIGVCRHFAVLLVGMLRAQGVPARARYGFGAYFNPPYFEEHVVCEYWNELEQRWILVDPQFDAIWRERVPVGHDPLDLPRTRFLIAADAWIACRTGRADPARFGIFVGDLRGLWFVAAELVRDLAALNRMEMLCWDDWGAMPLPDEPLESAELACFDRLARLTRLPNATFTDLRRHYQRDDTLRVPETVFNALRGIPEGVAESRQPSAVSREL
jgi:hypothetical protein